MRGPYTPYLNASGYWIDHTKDLKTLDVKVGLKLLLSTAFAPLTCLYIAYKVVQYALKYGIKLQNAAIQEEAQCFTT